MKIMKMMKALLAIVVTLCLAATAPAQTPVQTPDPSPGHRYFGDVKLVDQDGREMRFYTDLLQGKTVIINVMFTTCTGACPVMSGTVEKLQEHLGDRLGKDVRLLSISVDPVHDTPARLKEYASRFHARPGWYLLTGSRENVETVLRKLGQWVDDPSDHQTLFLIGNDRTGLWKKALAMAPTEEIFPIVDSVVGDPGDIGKKGRG
jgi:protein SCO1/2